jgi:hypothetical protein
MHEKSEKYKILGRKLEVKGPIWNSRHRWKDNIESNLKINIGVD